MPSRGRQLLLPSGVAWWRVQASVRLAEVQVRIWNAGWVRRGEVEAGGAGRTLAEVTGAESGLRGWAEVVVERKRWRRNVVMGRSMMVGRAMGFERVWRGI